MVRELHVKGAEDPTPSWERRVGLWHELVYEGAPLPDAFRELLDEQYQHLVSVPTREPEAERAWGAYLLWLGDMELDTPKPTPGERLARYFKEQEGRLA